MQKTWQVKMNFIAPLKVQVNFRQTEKLIYATVYTAAQWAQVYNYFKPCNLSAFKRSDYSAQTKSACECVRTYIYYLRT